MKHSYLVISFPSYRVWSQHLHLSLFPLVKVVDEHPFYVLGTVVPGYARHSGALAAIDHVKVFLRIDVINS